MINLIDEIIAIDKDARGKVKEAELEAKGILKAAHEEEETLKKEYHERIEKRLDIVRTQYEGFAKDEISAIESEYEKRVGLLEKAVSEKRSIWKQEILSRITGGLYE